MYTRFHYQLAILIHISYLCSSFTSLHAKTTHFDTIGWLARLQYVQNHKENQYFSQEKASLVIFSARLLISKRITDTTIPTIPPHDGNMWYYYQVAVKQSEPVVTIKCNRRYFLRLHVIALQDGLYREVAYARMFSKITFCPELVL